MKTIAVLESCGTKAREAKFIGDFIRGEGLSALVLNAATAHIKMLTDEAKEIGEIVAERLSKAAYPVKLLVPQGGMRHNTMEGEEPYSPETDAALVGPEDVPMVEAMLKEHPGIPAFLLADHGIVAMGKDPWTPSTRPSWSRRPRRPPFWAGWWKS